MKLSQQSLVQLENQTVVGDDTWCICLGQIQMSVGRKKGMYECFFLSTEFLFFFLFFWQI